MHNLTFQVNRCWFACLRLGCLERRSLRLCKLISSKRPITWGWSSRRATMKPSRNTWLESTKSPRRAISSSLTSTTMTPQICLRVTKKWNKPIRNRKIPMNNSCMTLPNSGRKTAESWTRWKSRNRRKLMRLRRRCLLSSLRCRLEMTLRKRIMRKGVINWRKICKTRPCHKPI